MEMKRVGFPHVEKEYELESTAQRLGMVRQRRVAGLVQIELEAQAPAEASLTAFSGASGCTSGLNVHVTCLRLRQWNQNERHHVFGDIKQHFPQFSEPGTLFANKMR